MNVQVRKKRILAADDARDWIEVVKVQLEAQNYEVVTAYDGAEALEKARTQSPDLVLLDVMLPNMSGFEVCRMLKFDKKFQNIPIVLLTSRDSQKDRLTGKEVGANEYIPKYNFSDVAIGKVQELVGN